jgi:diguanylate cyclase (GGDEF)-like protein
MNKFLIIDDDAVARKHLKRLFSLNLPSADVTTLGTSLSGVEAITNNVYDVVFIDYRMPGTDGIEVLMQTKGQSKFNENNLVMMLEQPDKALKSECLTAGAIEVIDKYTIDGPEMCEVIKSVAARQQVLVARDVSNVVPISQAKDSLTQILSRNEFEQSIRATMGLESQKEAAIVLLNINNFRSINELYGTDIGDKILQILAKRITLFAKNMVSVARVGGDEFAILVGSYKTYHDLKKIAGNVLSIINRPIHLNDHQVQVSASIGISGYPNDSIDEDELYKFAFIALYRAKQLGRNQVCFFEHEMQESVLRKHQIEQATKNILKNSTFNMVYQPIYDGQSGELAGVEALIRWPNETPVYYPDEFIPVAESSGSIIAIGKFVIETSLAQLAVWRSDMDSNLSMSVNVSPKQLLDETLPKVIRQSLAKNKLPAECLTLELTETALMESSQNITDILLELKSIGCNIALDDFGTGFSSVSHLLNFPIDIVKIDKSVLPTCDEEYKQHAVTKGLVMMLKQLGSVIVVEGIETQYQHTLIHELDVDKVQGYFYGRPCDPALFATNVETKLLTAVKR